MANQVALFNHDLHLYPLYMKWAAESFREGEVPQGEAFFNAACGIPIALEHKVYKQMWKLKVNPDGSRMAGVPEYGRKCFHGLDNRSSSTTEKAQAIETSLRKVDRQELTLRENKVHEHLWIIHGRPPGDNKYGKHAFNNKHGRSSSIGEKLVAARKYADESRILTWLTSNGEVRLIKRGDSRLERLSIDYHSGHIVSDVIATAGLSNDEMIAILSKCEATVNREAVGFSILPVCPTWPATVSLYWGTRELSLLLRDKNLIWRLFDKNSRTISFADAFDDVKDAMLHMEFTRRLEGRACIQDFSVDLKVTNINRIVIANINMIRAPSRLDKNVTLDSANWAVTLIVAGKSRSNPLRLDCVPETWAGHALLAIEGVENGQSFLRYAHLTAVGEHPTVEILDSKITGEFSIRDQSKTWIRKRHWARGMIKEIEKEVGTVMPFEVTSESLTLSGLKKTFDWLVYGERPFYIENCLIWSIKKLWLTGIEPPQWNYVPIPIEYVNTISSEPELVKFNPTCDS